MIYKVISVINANSNIEVTELLEKAVTYFGKSGSDLELKEVRITNKKIPMTFYPDRDENEIMIHLAETAKTSRQEYIYQLSHEITHTLFANKEDETCLEEGICTYFSLECIKDMFGLEEYTKFRNHSLQTKYMRSLLLVEEIMSWDSSFIKNMRMESPRLKKIFINQLSNLLEIIYKEDIIYLLKLFKNIWPISLQYR